VGGLSDLIEKKMKREGLWEDRPKNEDLWKSITEI
jgi:negative regulator of genetic competence, sporulation and motility